jgi:hypothetical protein
LGNGSAPEDISVAQAVMVGIKMAIKDTLPSTLPRHFVNLTVFNTKCEGINAAEGVRYLAAEGVSKCWLCHAMAPAVRGSATLAVVHCASSGRQRPLNHDVASIQLQIQCSETYTKLASLICWHAGGIIGDVCSTSSLAAAAANKQLQIPIISPAATSPSLSMKDFFFR